MPIFRIVPKTAREHADPVPSSDQFVEADTKEEAEKQFDPVGTASRIHSITITDHQSVNEPKLYLVGLNRHGRENERMRHYFLVRAINGANAEERIGDHLKESRGKYRNATSIEDLRYVGRLSERKGITELV